MAKDPMRVVENLDVSKYFNATWYEIANIPSRFQPKDGYDTTATYTVQEDGKTVRVRNECKVPGGKSIHRATLSPTPSLLTLCAAPIQAGRLASLAPLGSRIRARLTPSSR